MLALFAGTAVALAVAWLMIPPLAKAAWRWDFLDHPGAGHHVHTRPVPRLGGVAVFTGFIAGITVAALLSKGAPPARAVLQLDAKAVALIIAGTLLFFIGLLDDLKDIAPAIKLVGQTIAAGIVCWFGFRIESLSIPPGIVLHLGWLAIPISILWIVGVSNAFNLIDGIDGLAGGVALIALIAIAASGALTGGAAAPWYACILAGSLVGFLRFNVPPARIFLGDSGSLVVGFLLAVLSVKAATRADGILHPLVPVFVLSYPLLDTGIAIMRRWLRGAPLSRADDRHVHHQLITRGFTPRRALAIITVESAVVAAIGLSTAFARPFVTVAMAAAGVVALALILAAVSRWLGYHEFIELGQSFASATRDSRRMIRDAIHARDLTRLIAAARTLDEVSALLADGAVDLGFAHISVRLADTGNFTAAAQTLAAELWHLEYPIAVPASPNATIAHDPLSLVIWCRTDGTDRPSGAERIARILAPAIGHWIADLPRAHPDLIGALHPVVVRPPIHAQVIPASPAQPKPRAIAIH